MASQPKKQPSLIQPDWPAPDNVTAFSTTRTGGVSEGAYASFNLAQHVGDAPQRVNQNRAQLQAALDNKVSLFWLNQTHSNLCLPWSDTHITPNADASFTNQAKCACAVMTADCLPILLTNKQGDWVAACHAGWRGLADGVVENTIANYPGEKTDLIAWIGPAISQPNFEVGAEVRDIFISRSPEHNQFFELNPRQRYQFDFIGLAKAKLESMGVSTYGGELCSYADAERFYSYRRDGETGRMVSVIYFA